jgi:hypothetical protein
LYTVLPTYSKIKPKGDVQIKITYFLRDPNEDLSKHKFKFEALVIKREEIQNDIKEIFSMHDANKESKDKKYSLSRTVKLIIGKSKINDNIKTLNNLSLQNFNSQNNFNFLCVRI